jgi:hypothetical protein
MPGQTQENKRDKYDPASGRDASIQSHREGFFSFVMKTVNPKDIDFGELIAERRQALADASVTNPYFWYGAGSTIAVLILLFALYVKILEGNSFRWRSAEVIADLRNSEKLAIAKAKEAITRYNRHMSDCNRVIEAGIAGRALPGAVLGQDMERTVYSLRQELDASDEENRRLKQQLQEKETLVRDMTKRMDVLEQADPSVVQVPVNSSESISELMTVINRMARELDAEKRRNGVLKGA